MNELIQITRNTINGVEVNSVNAKDIYDYLGIKTHFTTWIQRTVDKYDFRSDIDFQSLSILKPSGQTENAVIVTLDMAKELCMVSNTVKGRETRRYFISVEKQSNKPLSIEQLLQENMKVISDLQNKVIELKPKALFADSVAQSQGSILVGEFAKLISDEDFKIGQNKLFAWLRDNSYLCCSGSKYNQPCQRYIDNGYFETIERTINNPDGSTRITITTKITGLGQVKLHQKIKGQL